MALSNKEKKAMLKARLRNMKRRYAKMIQHPDLAEECIELKCDVDSLEREIQAMK